MPRWDEKILRTGPRPEVDLASGYAFIEEPGPSPRLTAAQIQAKRLQLVEEMLFLVLEDGAHLPPRFQKEIRGLSEVVEGIRKRLRGR